MDIPHFIYPLISGDIMGYFFFTILDASRNTDGQIFV
jgi:hypothetical protein